MPKRIVLAALALSLLAVLLLMETMTGPVSAKPNMDLPQTGLTPLDGQHLFNDTFVRVDTVNALPPSVLGELLVTKEQAEKKGFGIPTAELVIREGMADPDQPFERSDMVGPKPLPFRRLIFAGVSTGYCFVYNEYGGFGSGTEVSLYLLPPPLPERAAPGPHSPPFAAAGHATLVWQASLRASHSFSTWEQLRRAIIRGRYYTQYIPPLPPSPMLTK